MKKYIFLLIILITPTTSQTLPTTTTTTKNKNKNINILSLMVYIYKIIDSGGYEEKKGSYTIMGLPPSLQEDEIHKLTDEAIAQEIIEAKNNTSNFLLQSLEQAKTKTGEHETIKSPLKELPEGFPIEEIKKLLIKNFEEFEHKQIYQNNTEILLIRFFGLCELHKKVVDAFKNNREPKEIVTELYRKNKNLNSSPTTDITKIADSGTADIKEPNETPGNREIDINRSESNNTSYNDFPLYTINKDTHDRLSEIYGTKLTNATTIKEEYNELEKILVTSQGAKEKATELYKKIKTFQTFYAAAESKKEGDRRGTETETENNYVYQDLLIKIDNNFPLHPE